MRQRLRGREWQAACLALLLIVLVEGGLLFTRGVSTGDSMPSSPPHIPLLAHATLLRTERVVSDQPSQTWYYSVPKFSMDDVLPFYRAQATHLGWRCFTSLATTHAQQGGKPLTGTGMYITAISGATFIQINTGSLEYGGGIVGDRLDDGSIGLKIALESSDNAPPCG